MNDDKFKAILAKHKTGSSGDDEQPAIGSIEEFTTWKHDFLSELKEFLDPIGTATAREADEELYIQLEGLAKSCMTTKTLCKEGKIGVDNSTVAGQRTINELCTTLKDCETSVEGYVPKTSHAAKKAGYTKFDLAAVAIRDGFRVYGLMCATRDYLAGLVTEGGPLEGVLRDNQLATIMYFFRCLEAFSETMADLGIYRVMEDCVEVYKVRPRGKKKKRSKKSGDGDALALSSDEERALSKLRKKELEDEDDGLVNGGRMFSNKLPAGKKTRAIMDKGWSNGFAPGEQIKGPDGGKKPKKNKSSKKDKKGGSKIGGRKGRGDGMGSSDDDNDDEESRDGTTDDEDEDGNSDDPAKQKSRSKKPSSKKGADGDGKDDDNSTTEPTEDEDDDESSSEEESDDDDSDDEDYIYYFDPVQKVVGKLPRTTCQQEKLIVTTDSSTGAEKLDGVVDHWDTKDEETPGKTDLIQTLREVLRSSAKQ